jgi:hypothetical protein
MLDVVNFPHLKDPRIGVLIREGRQIYYAHIDGEFPERNSADEILELLGVIPPRPQPPAMPREEERASYIPRPLPDLVANEKPGARGEWQTFSVKVVNRDIPWEAPGYFTVEAKSAKSALRRVREEMRSPAYHHTRRDGRLEFTIEEDY